MKISMFHLMPHRELPDDFEKRYPSVWVTPPWHELADPGRVGQYYNWTLDELLYAARSGFDGVCTNEHHQNAYGFMPSPNIMGAVLGQHQHVRLRRRQRRLLLLPELLRREGREVDDGQVLAGRREQGPRDESVPLGIPAARGGGRDRRRRREEIRAARRVLLSQ